MRFGFDILLAGGLQRFGQLFSFVGAPQLLVSGGVFPVPPFAAPTQPILGFVFLVVRGGRPASIEVGRVEKAVGDFFFRRMMKSYNMHCYIQWSHIHDVDSAYLLPLPQLIFDRGSCVYCI